MQTWCTECTLQADAMARNEGKAHVIMEPFDMAIYST